ncbi:unnamed protein product [Zymoseptoria tritici ST99CH_1A5]|uniref:Uncharacterized protein n=3 Tax=Zymoseptoria tritici TaxID=1047171 RepID=F9XAC4_ZYMTI|nr:uncharacterized protein MYCGRDRAFT_71496 [Zymoseptoria tritici IPO323]EGP88092.1 hypothetical protein MYCGRDRAFT_71496 [Zymoseptoria tritici IPO323]SMR51214.1 unnamed protein product [Zymoseptoria tritici ST99CH_1E4]SMR52247.1 unnamed protein product [Zymoseptoria tritici ST99CH_3D1]SMY23908.1 unnamed protein product [Zymoseptoria tritici ST99CH_1A5]
MASVPAEINIKNVTGSYAMNKKLSDSTGPMLKMQKIPWLVQQAANYSSVSVNLKQYTDDQGVVHVDQEQVSSVNTQHEPRILDNQMHERDIQYWGKVKGRSQFAKVADLQDAYLKEGWEGDEILESFAESLENGWTADQVWGFAEVEGVRRHVRRILSKKGKDELRIRLVYDWAPPS